MADRTRGRGAPLPTWILQAMKFAGVGLTAAAVDYSILRLGMAGGLGPELARIPAIALALTLTWVLNRTITFRTTKPPSWREFRHYVLAATGGAAINFCVYMLLLWAGTPVWLAFLLGVGISSIYTFLRYRRLLHHG